ncbi:hypothetical protein P4639_14480 [Priestia megaterium]|uniref:hypothetical protein n=1 Tax=Priestia megaterium TaxID=1404 RepID=UPI002E1E1368|nr:hypothetical protein [Priestia megaterium]
MKTLEEIIKQEPVYLNAFKDKQDMLEHFSDTLIDKEEVLFASYGDVDGTGLEGEAFVLFVQDGKLYEVNGNHCSCHGLEGQWEPEEVLLAELEHRLTKGNLGVDKYDVGNLFRDELCEFLGVQQ